MWNLVLNIRTGCRLLEIGGLPTHEVLVTSLGSLPHVLVMLHGLIMSGPGLGNRGTECRPPSLPPSPAQGS